jgi:hypothetical protein
MTKLTTLCCLFTVVLCAQGPRGGRYPNRGLSWTGQASRAPVTGAPYSGIQTTQSQRVLADGNQVSTTEQSKVYRDSQGRTRVERTITPPASSVKQPYTEATIVDPVAGYRYVLNSSTMTAIQMAIPARTGSTSGTPPVRTGPASGIQLVTVSLGTQTVNSVTATGTQVTETIPAGTIGNSQPITVVRTRWISTDLKVPVEVKSSDPRFGTTDMELTSIQQSPPDPSLFTVPSGYTVKTGSGTPGAAGVPAGRWGRSSL